MKQIKPLSNKWITKRNLIKQNTSFKELITKQQLEIEHYKKNESANKKILHDIHNKFIGIGQPLNDNILQFNKAQMKWCFEVFYEIEALNSSNYNYEE